MHSSAVKTTTSLSDYNPTDLENGKLRCFLCKEATLTSWIGLRTHLCTQHPSFDKEALIGTVVEAKCREEWSAKRCLQTPQKAKSVSAFQKAFAGVSTLGNRQCKCFVCGKDRAKRGVIDHLWKDHASEGHEACRGAETSTHMPFQGGVPFIR